MISYIEDTSKDKERPKEVVDYFAKFGEYPNIIGIFWQDPNQLKANIIKAIETNKPYDEYKLLSKDEQMDFDKGVLFF